MCFMKTFVLLFAGGMLIFTGCVKQATEHVDSGQSAGSQQSVDSKTADQELRQLGNEFETSINKLKVVDRRRALAEFFTEMRDFTDKHGGTEVASKAWLYVLTLRGPQSLGTIPGDSTSYKKRCPQQKLFQTIKPRQSSQKQVLALCTSLRTNS